MAPKLGHLIGPIRLTSIVGKLSIRVAMCVESTLSIEIANRLRRLNSMIKHPRLRRDPIERAS